MVYVHVHVGIPTSVRGACGVTFQCPRLSVAPPSPHAHTRHNHKARNKRATMLRAVSASAAAGRRGLSAWSPAVQRLVGSAADGAGDFAGLLSIESRHDGASSAALLIGPSHALAVAPASPVGGMSGACIPRPLLGWTAQRVAEVTVPTLPPTRPRR